MCNFFSFITEPEHYPGKKFCFDWEYRKEHLKDECDSHASLAEYFHLHEDKCNKYEYNPLTGLFTIDQINSSTDDSLQVEEWVKRLKFKRIVEPLIVKPIVNPLLLPKKELSPDDILLLKEWASVRASVGASVWTSVRAPVWASVGASVCDSVCDSVGASVWTSVRAPVWTSVWDSVGASVGASVCDSVRAYTSSFFAIDYEFDYSNNNKLWESGIVPSYANGVWRLHSGEKADIIFEITAEELKNYQIKEA